MPPENYDEGRLRKYLLIHRNRIPFARCRVLRPQEWCPIGVGIHIPSVSGESGGSIDVLMLGTAGEFAVVEIKKRSNTERGQKPIEQSLRYINGLRAYKSCETLLGELKRKWRSKGTHNWVRIAATEAKSSSRFEKAMEQFHGALWRDSFKKAFKRLWQEDPPILIVQNDRLHPKSVTAIKAARMGGCRIWGIQVPFPHDQGRGWKVV